MGWATSIADAFRVYAVLLLLLTPIQTLTEYYLSKLNYFPELNLTSFNVSLQGQQNISTICLYYTQIETKSKEVLDYLQTTCGLSEEIITRTQQSDLLGLFWGILKLFLSVVQDALLNVIMFPIVLYSKAYGLIKGNEILLYGAGIVVAMWQMFHIVGLASIVLKRLSGR